MKKWSEKGPKKWKCTFSDSQPCVYSQRSASCFSPHQLTRVVLYIRSFLKSAFMARWFWNVVSAFINSDLTLCPSAHNHPSANTQMSRFCSLMRAEQVSVTVPLSLCHCGWVSLESAATLREDDASEMLFIPERGWSSRNTVFSLIYACSEGRFCSVSV